MKLCSKYSLIFVLHVLACCVVIENVFKASVNTQCLGLKQSLPLPNVKYAYIHEKVLATEHLRRRLEKRSAILKAYKSIGLATLQLTH